MTSLASLGPDSMVGSYRIVEEIGRGGMGTVYRAEHTLLPRRAAIKIMHGELLRQPGMATRMVQEAAILEDIKHPGIVRVFECNLLPDHRPYIIMELVDGESLAARLLAQGTLAASEVARLLGDICDVLVNVHKRGITHRDMKPDNILLTPTDRNGPLRLIDWGVAHLGPAGRLTLDGMTPGTPIYMSPEQATGKNIGAPCDIYSLGVMAYEMLCGHPPFDGRTLAEVVCMHLSSEPVPLVERTCAPKELCELVHRMLEKDPGARPSAVEVRRRSRAIGSTTEHGGDYAEMTVTHHRQAKAPAAPPLVAHVPVPPEPRHAQPPTQEVVVVDPESLEFGTTEMLPIVRRPRWTPEMSRAVPGLLSVPESARRGAITPRASRDQVAGEFDLPDKRRT